MRYPWAVPGAKVVCVLGGVIDARPNVLRTNPTPVKGEIYTITEILLDRWDGSLRVCIAERPNGSSVIPDQGWCVTRFRPLHTQETDMELFAHLLTPSPNSPMLPVRPIKEPMGQ